MDKNTEIPLKWEEGEQKSWKSTFIDTLKKIFRSSENNNNINNDDFTEFGESEEEKALIREQCEEIDLFYKNRTDLVEAKKVDSELREGDWLLREMEKEANDICRASEGRDLTTDELKAFRQQVKKQLDKDIIAESKGLDEDIKIMNEIVLNQKEEDKL